MRLGGPIFNDAKDPKNWISELRRLSYRAAYCPVSIDASHEVVQEFSRAAAQSDILIAEVGSWCNPLSSDIETRKKSIERCIRSLDLAERIGAVCCVNISGSCGEQWDGPHPDNLTPATFQKIVETTQKIIDAVKPERAFYTLETMPWAYPDSLESYLELIEAIDRPQFAVHLDPANLINSPRKYYENGLMISECFEKLGTRIKSCHAKDILLSPRLTVHLDEVRPGLGNLDFRTFLRETSRLKADVPMMLEHLPAQEEYALAAEFIRGVLLEIETNEINSKQ